MRPVFSADLLKFLEQGDVVELIVAIGILNPIKAAAHMLFFIYDDIKRVEGVAESPGVSDIKINFFEVIIGESLARGWAVEAIKPAILISGDESSFVVFTKDDPGTEVFFGD